jgi:hypothetical protein
METTFPPPQCVCMYIRDGGLRSTLTLQISNPPSALRRSHRNSLDPQTPLALALRAPASASASRRRRDDPCRRRCRCGAAPPARMRHGLQLRLHSARALPGTHLYAFDPPRFLPALRPPPPPPPPRFVASQSGSAGSSAFSPMLRRLSPCERDQLSTLGYAMVAFNLLD